MSSLAFSSPLILSALALLPVLWLLLRLTPPAPVRVDFPPLRLLLDLVRQERSPARSPWWLTMLRLLMAAVIVIALAGPVWRPLSGSGVSSAPLLVLVDNGWASAAQWQLRKEAVSAAIATAADTGRSLALVGLAEPPDDISLLSPRQASEKLLSLEPRSWQPDRSIAAGHIAAFLKNAPTSEIQWFSDGLAGEGDKVFLPVLAGQAKQSSVTLYMPSGGALALSAASNTSAGITLRIVRAGAAPESGSVSALDMKGLVLAQTGFSFAAGSGEASAAFDLPVELRNDVARVQIDGETTAGAVQLMDRNWRRRVVALVTGQDKELNQPLLSANYFLSRALEPFADIRQAQDVSPGEAVRSFIDQKVPIIILSDVGKLGDTERRLADWIEKGGMLVRFAGSRMAAGGSELSPVTLREGGRTFNGALSWSKAQKLGAFPQESPFAGLAVPGDVDVRRQLLAEPDIDLPGKTWAVLADGTPLVTASKRGKGLLVLFHVTADTTWSDLPLSGTFVAMLRKIISLSTLGGVEATAAKKSSEPVYLAPYRTLNGYGVLETPPATVRPIRADQPGIGRPDHPSGYYGPVDALSVVNTLAANASLKPLDPSQLPLRVLSYTTTGPLALGPVMLIFALVLLMIDTLLMFFITRGWSRLRSRPVAGAAVLAVCLFAAMPDTVHAQSRPFDSALQTRLAYIVTGDRETDDTSLAGLKGLSTYIAERTALEPGPPVGLDPAKDELAFYALIYWPIVPGKEPPPPAVMARIDAFMKSGGTIVFDTRDALLQTDDETITPAGQTLKQLVSMLDIPELEPLAPRHVLTKTFYLLDKFEGRYDTGETWVQALPESENSDDRPVQSSDGVSPVIITSNDLAGAWAVDDGFNPLYPVSSSSERQRELAYRAGVNIVMYALTGNYKGDQVHVKDLIERLGR